MKNHENRQETQEYYRLDYNKLGSLTAAHSRNQAYDAAYRYMASLARCVFSTKVWLLCSRMMRNK